jgi:polyisoprenoid-binding protein YceI
MKTAAALILSLFGFLAAGAQLLHPVDKRSTVHFVIKNFGVNTGGDFKGLQGSIVFDPANPSVGVFDVSVDAATVNTDVEGRDRHLRREEYFNTEKFPKISFKSERVELVNRKGDLKLFGKLTIKGTARDISFPFTAVPDGNGYLFTGNFEIDRRDFRLGGNSLVLGDKVAVMLSVFAVKQ